jgi:hypothetical protein
MKRRKEEVDLLFEEKDKEEKEEEWEEK